MATLAAAGHMVGYHQDKKVHVTISYLIVSMLETIPKESSSYASTPPVSIHVQRTDR